MMEFDKLNYYELLEIPPESSLFEIEKAYRNALTIYNEDSLLTYSLFVHTEREHILKKIETAYHTLIDADKRKLYDAMLRSKFHILNHGESHNDLSLHADEPEEGNHKTLFEQRCVENGGETLIATCSQNLEENGSSRKPSPKPIAKMSPIFGERSKANKEPRISGSSVARSFYILLAIIVVLLFIVFGSYAIFTSSELLKKIHSTSFNDDSRINAKTSEVLVGVPMVRENKNDPDERLEDSVKVPTKKDKSLSPRNLNPEVYINLVSSANIRSQPTIDSTVITRFQRGREIKLIGKHGAWLKLKLADGRIGWIHHTLAQKSEEGASAAIAWQYKPPSPPQ